MSCSQTDGHWLPHYLIFLLTLSSNEEIKLGIQKNVPHICETNASRSQSHQCSPHCVSMTEGFVVPVVLCSGFGALIWQLAITSGLAALSDNTLIPSRGELQRAL